MNMVWVGSIVAVLVLFATHVYVSWKYQEQQEQISHLESELERSHLLYNEKFLSLAEKKHNTRTLLYQRILSEERSFHSILDQLPLKDGSARD